MLSDLNPNGFAIIPDVLDTKTVSDLRAALEPLSAGDISVSQRGETAFAVRNLLQISPAVRALAQSSAVRSLIESVLGRDCRAVRGILFDKKPGANWNVVWHQDLSVAVREKRSVPGWGPWSVKAGVVHVQPPPEVLACMLTIRLHLDHCGAENGPLRVLPGTHTLGRLSPAQIADLRQHIPETVCAVGVGGALLMRPLLLHASSDADEPGHRRVVHLEFAEGKLPHGLEWNEQITPVID